MPVNDDELDTKISETDSLYRESNAKNKELNSILSNLDSIRKIKKVLPAPPGSATIGTALEQIVMELPMDKTTGLKITEARRTQIFTEQRRRLTALTT